jgi:hypothetical protein
LTLEEILSKLPKYIDFGVGSSYRIFELDNVNAFYRNGIFPPQPHEDNSFKRKGVTVVSGVPKSFDGTPEDRIDNLQNLLKWVEENFVFRNKWIDQFGEYFGDVWVIKEEVKK